MGITMASQIISLTSVHSTVYSGVDQKKHQSSALPAFVRGIHRRPVNSPHKRPVKGKSFHLMTSSCEHHKYLPLKHFGAFQPIIKLFSKCCQLRKWVEPILHAWWNHSSIINSLWLSVFNPSKHIHDSGCPWLLQWRYIKPVHYWSFVRKNRHLPASQGASNVESVSMSCGRHARGVTYKERFDF